MKRERLLYDLSYEMTPSELEYEKKEVTRFKFLNENILNAPDKATQVQYINLRNQLIESKNRRFDEIFKRIRNKERPELSFRSK